MKSTAMWRDRSPSVASILLAAARRKQVRLLFYPHRARAIWPLLIAAGFRKRWWMPTALFLRVSLLQELPLTIALMPFVELVNRNFPNGGACWCGTGRFKYDQATGNRADAAWMAHGLRPPGNHFAQMDITPFFHELEPYLEPPRE